MFYLSLHNSELMNCYRRKNSRSTSKEMNLLHLGVVGTFHLSLENSEERRGNLHREEVEQAR